jgi:hypothetical protein
MTRSLSLLYALAVAAPVLMSPPVTHASDRAMPMRFELRKADPSANCSAQCGPWVTAAGAITADTPRDFKLFAKSHDLRGLTLALDSDGGSVLGAISLGREIRALGITTTVGRAVDLDKGDENLPFATLSPRADCQSMCAFVLLGGLHRIVPPDARVMVHQIWLGDRREDPTAAHYSAEDLVLVQHDIGSLAQYTIDMGASIDMLDLSLRIPPWEPMHTLSADEISRMKVATDIPAAPAPATVAAAQPAIAPVAASAPLLAPLGNAVEVTAISEQHWTMVEQSGAATLARRHPLTVEGEDIGSFDLSVACSGTDSYEVSYAEHRHAGDEYALPSALTSVMLTVGSKAALLKVVSTQHSSDPEELTTIATAIVPVSFIDSFAAAGSHSLMITTKSAGVSTGIRIGNTGAMQNLPRLASSCTRALGDRAELSTANKIGGLAAAR